MLNNLVQQLDFHPLAIVHLCQSHSTKPSAVLHRWQDHGLSSLSTESKEPGEAPLPPSINNSINRLSSDAKKLFWIICTLPAGVMLQDLNQNIDETARLFGNLSLSHRWMKGSNLSSTTSSWRRKACEILVSVMLLESRDYSNSRRTSRLIPLFLTRLTLNPGKSYR